MPRLRTKSLLKLGLLLCLGLLGFGGKMAGRQLARSGMIDRTVAVPKPAKSGDGEAVPQERRKQEASRADLVAASYKRIKALIEGSPALMADWEAQAEIDAILAKLNAAELGEIFGMLGYPSDNFHLLATKVGTAWMAKDPDAALRGMLEKTPRAGDWIVRSAFGSWAQDDPDAALAWLDGAVLPEGPEEPAKLRDGLRGHALMGLVERDFERATAEYRKMKEPENWDGSNSGVMGVWGRQYVDDPLMRGRLLEFAKSTGNPRDHAELNRALLLDWPQEDAMGMMNYLHELRGYLESDATPAAQRPEMDGTAVAAAIYREYDRPALEWWMERYGQNREAPAPMRDAMGQWAQKYPDKVLQWVAEQPSSPQRDALAAATIPSFARQGKFTEAAQMIDGMGDAAYRQSAGERLEILWGEKDAGAAAEWRKGLGGGE